MKDIKNEFFIGIIIVSGIIAYIMPEMSGLGKIITRILLISGLMVLAKIKLSKIKEKAIDFKSNFKLAIKDIIISAIIMSTMGIGISNIMFFCFYVWKPEILIKFIEMISNQETSIYTEVLGLILGVLIAPIVEELIFRGVIFTKLLNRMSMGKAMIISSIIFAVVHLNLAMVGAVISGVLWCILYVKYKNILVPIVLHSINNLIASIPSFMENVFNKGDLTSLSMDSIVYNQIKFEFIIGIIMVIISSILIVVFIRKNYMYIKNIKIHRD